MIPHGLDDKRGRGCRSRFSVRDRVLRGRSDEKGVSSNFKMTRRTAGLIVPGCEALSEASRKGMANWKQPSWLTSWTSSCWP